MSSANQPITPIKDDGALSVVVISHSPFFYWWPVWVVGFIISVLSFVNGYQVAFVPPGTVAERAAKVEGFEGRRNILIAPAGGALPGAPDSFELKQPRLRMVIGNDLGIIWAFTLCLIIIISHVHIRGMWAVIGVVVFVVATILLAIFGLWDTLFWALQFIDIHITASGYFSISFLLLILWLLMTLVYDRRMSMVFTKGQLKVRMAVGAAETVHETRGMVVEKHREGLIRHWLLGFGSGDLTVHTAGTNPMQFEWPNVLRIDRKLAIINTMIEKREVVKAR